MSLCDWAKPTATSDILEIPVARRDGRQDAELEAVIRLNLRHDRAARRFGLFVSALAIMSVPMAVVLFTLYLGGTRGATTTVLALWIVVLAGAAVAGLRAVRLMAQLDAAARRGGAKRRKTTD